jgi:hypothetical protein
MFIDTLTIGGRVFQTGFLPEPGNFHQNQLFLKCLKGTFKNVSIPYAAIGGIKDSRGLDTSDEPGYKRFEYGMP